MNFLEVIYRKSPLVSLPGLIIFGWLLAFPAQCAPQAAAVVDDGYAGKVLQKILNTGKLKIGQRQDARLYLDDSGNLIDCRSLKGDVKAICAAAKAAAPFGTPPYGVPINITLALWTGQLPATTTVAETASPQTKSEKTTGNFDKYLTRARRALRNSIYIPQQTRPGVYEVATQIKIDKAGKILDSAITKGSGDKLLDKYVLQGLRRAGSVPKPPEGIGDTLNMTFTLTRQ